MEQHNLIEICRPHKCITAEKMWIMESTHWCSKCGAMRIREDPCDRDGHRDDTREKKFYWRLAGEQPYPEIP